MGKLTTRGRKSLPASQFALPKERKYPIEDKGHAKAALGRVSANGTSLEKSKVKAAVHKKYPSMKISKK